MSVDSGSGDGPGFEGDDKQPNDYHNIKGTSMAAPFVAGCAGLVIEALQERRIMQGVDPAHVWDFDSGKDSLFIKMVLCATATETGKLREDGNEAFSPPLQRAEPGPMGYPPGKDPYEGYGMINADAAVEAVYLEYAWSTEQSDSFGGGPRDRRAWARWVRLEAGVEYVVTLTHNKWADFDLYLYDEEPGHTGTPTILASSTTAWSYDPDPLPPCTGRTCPPTLVPGDPHESIVYVPSEDKNALLVAKRVAGSGDFTINSSVME